MRPHPALAGIRRNLLRGLFLILPLLITIWLLGILFELIDAQVTPIVLSVLAWAGVPISELKLARLILPIVSLLLTGLFVYLLGLFVGNLAGRRIVAFVESVILRIPLVKGVYGSARQLLDAFSLTGERTFSTVVMIEYPRRGLWTLAFVTNDRVHHVPLKDGSGRDLVSLFLPTTPNPTSGWLMLVPTDDIIVLDMTVEDGIKLVVSGGIVAPDNLGTRIRGHSLAQAPVPPSG